jgi:ABC-2 type transport system permease protein/lipopolysaccharide transport system permease protein
MVSAPDPGAGPPAELLFRRRIQLRRSLGDLWRARELIFTLAQRDFLVRYKQAELGLAWAVVTPLVLVGIFSLLFQRISTVDTHGAPYALFAYLGLLVWTFFSSSLAQGAGCLLNNRALLNKVRFPREVFAISAVVVAALDTAIATVILGLLFVAYGVVPEATSVWIPALLAVQVTFTLACALLASVVVVYLRDLQLVIPILLQVGLFATPVAYGLDAVPKSFLPFYSALDPLGPVIDGYRRTVLFGQAPDLVPLAIAATSAALMLLGAYAIFKRLESGITDVA